jgi:Tfp pilus assembly protein PilF
LVLGILPILGLISCLIALHVRAEYHCRAARSALARRDLVQARAHLALCLELRPQSGEVALLAAQAARRAGDYDDAERYLKAYRRLGGVPEALELERFLLRAQRGDLEPVQGYLLACVAKDHPDANLILEALAQGCIKTYRLHRAVYCLEQWLEREPNNVRALIWLAEVEELRDNPQRALAHYRLAAQLDPDNDEAGLNLARILRSEEPAEAFRRFERLRLRRPGDARVLLGLARCQRDLGQTEEALGLLHAVLDIEPYNLGALTDLGQLARESGRPGEAEVWLRKVLAKDPTDRAATYALALCLEQLGKRAQSKEYEAKLWLIDEASKRLRQLTRQIAATPHDPMLRCQVGLILLEQGQDREGLRWLLSALQEDRGHRPTRQALADYYKRSRRSPAGVAELASGVGDSGPSLTQRLPFALPKP